MPSITPQPCVGPCNRWWRELDDDEHERSQRRHLEAEAHDGAARRPWFGEPYWCRRCATLVECALDELPGLLVDIRIQALYGTPAPSVSTVHATHTAPRWPGQTARELTDLIVGGLVELEDEMRALLGWSPRVDDPDAPDVQGRREGVRAVAAINLLSKNYLWLLDGHPNAADPEGSPGACILRWRNAAQRYTGQDRPRDIIRDRPCPKCRALALMTVPGTADVECGLCKTVLRPEEFQAGVTRELVHEINSVPCPQCGQTTLMHRPGTTVVECRACRRVLSESAVLAVGQARREEAEQQGKERGSDAA